LYKVLPIDFIDFPEINNLGKEEEQDWRTRIYIPLVSPEEIISLSGYESLESIMKFVFDAPVSYL